MKARELGFDVNEQTPAVKDVLEELKRLEFGGLRVRGGRCLVEIAAGPLAQATQGRPSSSRVSA